MFMQKVPIWVSWSLIHSKVFTSVVMRQGKIKCFAGIYQTALACTNVATLWGSQQRENLIAERWEQAPVTRTCEVSVEKHLTTITDISSSSEEIFSFTMIIVWVSSNVNSIFCVLFSNMEIKSEIRTQSSNYSKILSDNRASSSLAKQKLNFGVESILANDDKKDEEEFCHKSRYL